MNGEQAVSARTGEPMRCPTCGSRLVEVDRSDVLIDACPSCRGVWLDRGELDKILVKERQMGASDPDDDFYREVEGRRGRSQPVHRGDDDDDDRDYRSGGRGRRRRGGLLDDLLDFDLG